MKTNAACPTSSRSIEEVFYPRPVDSSPEREGGPSFILFYRQAQSTFSTQVPDLTFLTFHFARPRIAAINPQSYLRVLFPRMGCRLFRRKYLIFSLLFVTRRSARSAATHFVSAPATRGQITGQIETDNESAIFDASDCQPEPCRIIQKICLFKMDR